MNLSKNKTIQRSILFFIIFIGIGIMYLKVQPTSSDMNENWPTFLKDREFSCLIEYNGWIYAGGANGLYRINLETRADEEVKINQRSLSMVRALYIDETNRLWVGHRNGLSILGEKIVTINSEDGLLNTQILDFLPMENGRVLASTFDGIALIEKDTVVEFIKEAPYLPGPTIKSLYYDSQGFTWYGAFSNLGGGITVKRDDHIQKFSIESGLIHDNITSIVETEKNTILIGSGLHTKGGANELAWDEGSWRIVRTLTKSDGLVGDKVRHIFIDDEQYYWFCSEYDGVAILKDMKSVRILNTETGLSHNEVKIILKDSEKDLWLGTKSGLTVIPKSWLTNNLYSVLNNEQ